MSTATLLDIPFVPAEMLAVPCEMVLANPCDPGALLIVATEPVLLLQVTDAVRS